MPFVSFLFPKQVQPMMIGVSLLVFHVHMEQSAHSIMIVINRCLSGDF